MLAPYLILAILVITMGLFVSRLWRYDIIALLALAASVAIGVVPYSSAFDGLANPAVITVACVMVISQAIHRSNLLGPLGKQIIRAGGKSATAQVGVLSITTAFFSAFMNNIGALGLMMPIAIRVANCAKRSASLVLLPIALASALGGLITMIGTPSNLLIANFRQQATGQAFDMFDFSRVGIIIAVLGLLFIALLGWRLIPGSRKSAITIEERFAIKDYITEIKLSPRSPLIGQSISEIEQYFKSDYILIALVNKKKKRFTIPADYILSEEDILIIETSPEQLERMLAKAKCEITGGSHKGAELLHSDEMITTEVTIPPGSKAINRSAKQMRLKKNYDINLLGISRQGNPFRERIHQESLKAGDVILLYGSADNIAQSLSDYGLLALEQRHLNLDFQGKKWSAMVIFIIALVIAAAQILPVSIAFSGAVLALVLTRTIQTRHLYETIEWPVIILLAAMIPIGEAFQITGGSDLITHFIQATTGHFSPLFIMSLLFIVTMTLSDFMNNAATTVVMAPIAISIAQALHTSIDPFLMAVAIAASCSFLTPVGHQNNIIVMGPGGYRFTDYIRVGLPLELLVMITAIPAIFWLWPM